MASSAKCAGVPDELLRGREPPDVADLRGDRGAEHPSDPGDGLQEPDLPVVGSGRAEVARAGVNLGVELVDEAKACREGGRLSRSSSGRDPSGEHEGVPF
jgi:hypothetical protein